MMAFHDTVNSALLDTDTESHLLVDNRRRRVADDQKDKDTEPPARCQGKASRRVQVAKTDEDTKPLPVQKRILSHEAKTPAKKWGDNKISERGRSVLVMRARYRSVGLTLHQRGWKDDG